MKQTIEQKVADCLAGVDEHNEDALDDLEVKLADMRLAGHRLPDDIIAQAVEQARGLAAIERDKIENGYRNYLIGGCRDVVH
jgi:hypothetical protein